MRFRTSVFVVFVSIYAASILNAAELVSHYKFDGNGQNEVNGAPDGTPMDGATFEAGRAGQSLSLADGAWFDTTFDGFPNADDGLYSGTVAFWVKWNSEEPPANIQFLGNLNASDTTAILVGTNGAGGMQIFPRSVQNTALIARDGGEGDLFNPDMTWADGEWHHLAYAWEVDDVTGFAEFFIDGEPLPDINYRQNNLITDDEFTAWEFPMSIGARNARGVLDMFVTANLDDFRIYDGMLTEEEVLSLLDPVVDILGDFDQSGVLDTADIDLLSEVVRSGSNDTRFDLNADELVTTSDRIVWIEDLRNTYLGDSNLDGEFNSTDFVSVFTSKQYEDGFAGNSTWATGDWNGDTEFDSSDFVAAFTGAGYEQGPRAIVQVPEPTFGLVTIACVWGLIRVSARRFW